MKSADEAIAKPTTSTPMELACASLEVLVGSVRLAVEANNHGLLLRTLELIDQNSRMIRQWLDEAAHQMRTPAPASSSEQ